MTTLLALLNEPFFLRALLVGAVVAAMAGPLGCFLVWRRMAYFGDSLAHSALLGIALGTVAGVAEAWGIIAVGTLFAVSIALLQQSRTIAADTWLGILAHGALALGLVVLALTQARRADLFAFLFGDILAVTPADVGWTLAAAALTALALAILWRPMLLLTLHADLARAEGVRVRRVHLAYAVLLAIVTAVSIRVVGVLLITSLLIIPAATARLCSRSPGGMALTAAAVGVVAALSGLCASAVWDVPSGPAIVVAAAALFTLALLVGASLTAQPRIVR